MTAPKCIRKCIMTQEVRLHLVWDVEQEHVRIRSIYFRPDKDNTSVHSNTSEVMALAVFNPTCVQTVLQNEPNKLHQEDHGAIEAYLRQASDYEGIQHVT